MMGVDFFFRCEACNNKRVESTYVDGEYEDISIDSDNEYHFSWHTINVEELIGWFNRHKEHGNVVLRTD